MCKMMIEIDDAEFNAAVVFYLEKAFEDEETYKNLVHLGIDPDINKTFDYSKNPVWIKIMSAYAKDMILNQSDEWNLIDYVKDKL